jgi:hypothetical protein
MNSKLPNDRNLSSSNYIISYPRSGSHLTRYLVELMTKRPTLGCLGNLDDTSIFLRPNVCFLGDLTSSYPIARKAHYVSEVRTVPQNILMVIRNPVDAFISENLLKYSTDLKAVFKDGHADDVDKYIRILDLYENFSGKKALVKYEDLLSPSYERAVRSIANAYEVNEVTIVSTLKNYQQYWSDSLNTPLRAPVTVNKNNKLKLSRSNQMKLNDPDGYKKLIDLLSPIINHDIMKEQYCIEY